MMGMPSILMIDHWGASKAPATFMPLFKSPSLEPLERLVESGHRWPAPDAVLGQFDFSGGWERLESRRLLKSRSARGSAREVKKRRAILVAIALNKKNIGQTEDVGVVLGEAPQPASAWASTPGVR